MACASDTISVSETHRPATAKSVIFDMEVGVGDLVCLADALNAVSADPEASAGTICFLAGQIFDRAKAVQAEWTLAFKLSRAH